MITLRMAMNCRHRLEPKLDSYYFKNTIQSIPTYVSAGDVLSRDLQWCAEQLNKNLKAHDNGTVRPVSVRSGRANQYHGKILHVLGREGGGTVDLEVVLEPETMPGLELDSKFMYYVSGY
ncbi:unnamed protein product [Ilex paraguariensis]|uniref:Uncharacterized protein n=1 Tax=Ilex paraguariensis TaxID=185542 RepID=A0ABC8R102_9AQUA